MVLILNMILRVLLFGGLVKGTLAPFFLLKLAWNSLQDITGIYLKWRLNLEKAGLVNSITNAVIYIDAGRKGFAIEGKEHEGRISY